MAVLKASLYDEEWVDDLAASTGRRYSPQDQRVSFCASTLEDYRGHHPMVFKKYAIDQIPVAVDHVSQATLYNRLSNQRLPKFRGGDGLVGYVHVDTDLQQPNEDANMWLEYNRGNN